MWYHVQNMNSDEIKKFIESFTDKRARTIVIVDYGNVEKWKNNLGWYVGMQELSKLSRHFSSGSKFLRRFYYGADYGKDEKSTVLNEWSRMIFEKADWGGFELIDKRVKYIHSADNIHGFEKKCDLDVDMVVDLFRERDNYDTIILFSGDGDLMSGIRYLGMEYGKKCIVFGARGHVGREVYDAEKEGFVEKICYAEDFEYRLNSNRFRKR